MINPETTVTGDYVEATDNIYDFAVPGTIFKIIDRRIPGDANKALGWLINEKTGEVSGNQAYPLPHDKVSPLNRPKFASLIRIGLSGLEAKKKQLDREIDLIRSRARNVENTSSREEEETVFLRSIFGSL